MPTLLFPEYRPDVSPHSGDYSANISNVIPRGDGYGPFQSLIAATAALPSACRGILYARNSDASISVFAATATDLFLLNNTTFTWKPVSKAVALTSISNASPCVITLNSHGMSIGDPVVFSTTGSLPTGLTVGTVYYVISAGFTANAFQVSATAGGVAINTSSAGSGTHSYTAHYSAIPTTGQWQIRQFNKYVIAVHQNIAPQVLDLTSSAAFANLGGSPPQAAYIAIVNRFVVLCGIASTGVYDVQWSDLNGITTWDGTGQSDTQTLPDGGIILGVTGGEFGVIFQNTSIRRLTYASGAPYVFSIDQISSGDGLFAPYSLIDAGNRIFFCSLTGFKMMQGGGYPIPIGKEKVDRTFFADVDSSNLHLVIGAADPRKTRVYWAYKSVNSASSKFDKILCYDWALEKWTTISMTGEYLSALSRPGMTLEGVDVAYGSSIDALSVYSLDDVPGASIVEIAAFDATHKLGYFTSTNLEATLETKEMGGDGKRIFVRGFRLVGDAPTVYGSVSYRETEQASVAYSSESFVNAVGICPQRVSTRFSRGRVRIPAGTAWTYAAGVEPDFAIEGDR